MSLNNASVAAIEFALETDSGLEFLRCWSDGEFDSLREEWPEVPDAVFDGADPLYKKQKEPGDEDERTVTLLGEFTSSELNTISLLMLNPE